MPTIILPTDLHNAIINISYQLEKANEIRERELEIREKELELQGVVI